MKCGFIGCGNMGGALAVAVAKGNPDIQIVLTDTITDKASDLANTVNGTVADLTTVVDQCDVIFLGVKPQGMVGLFEKIAPVLAKRTNKPLLISMAAGVSLATIQSLAGENHAIVRIMPNTPVKLGLGMIEICHNQYVSKEQLSLVLQLLDQAGCLDVIEEEMIDAASAIAGSGPAFVYLFAELLAKGAEQCGVPMEKGIMYAAQTLIGSANMLLAEGKTPKELRDAVCSPGGSTLAGLTALENDSFENAVQEAIKRAYARSKELGKV